MPFLWVLGLWPLIEIALFVVIGGRIGLAATLGVIVATGALGVWVLRRVGRHSNRVAASHPGRDAADAALRAVAAIFLILPGFLTDLLGLILLVPALRHALIGLGLARLAMRFGPLRQAASRAGADRSTWDNRVIDAEYVEVTPASDPKDR